MSTVVLDSSVIAKWFFPEPESKVALKIKEDFANKVISISVPLLIFYEINNLLKTAIKSLRIDEKRAFAAYLGFLNLDFVTYSSKELMMLTLEKAIQLDISSYDTSYVVLAEYLQIPLYTADYKLQQKAKSHFVKNLTDYQISN